LGADLEKQLKANRLKTYESLHSLPNGYIASPLGLTDKSDGSKASRKKNARVKSVKSVTRP
jgi:hypothetical protein